MRARNFPSKFCFSLPIPRTWRPSPPSSGVFVVMMATSLAAWAATAAAAADTESFAFPSLRRGGSASQTALGGPGGCGEAGAQALRSNPAGLARGAASSWEGGHQAFQSDLRLEWTGFAVPLGSGSLGVDASVLHAGSFEGWDSEGNATGSFRPFESSAAIGYGLPVAPGFRCGATVRGLFLSGPDSRCWGFACDLGVEKDLGAGRLGFALRNLGPDARSAERPYPLPTEATAGIDWAIAELADVAVSGLLDRAGGVSVRSGVRLRAGGTLALLCGGSYASDVPAEERIVPRAGFELRFEPVAIAYAFASEPGGDATHHFSIALYGAPGGGGRMSLPASRAAAPPSASSR